LTYRLGFALNDDGFEAALKDMANAVVGPVVPLGTDPVALAHASAQIAFNGFHNDVKVVTHEAVGMTTSIEAVTNLPQQRQPLPAINILQVNGLPAIAARGDMKQAPGEFNAQRSCHRRTLAGGVLHCKT
jgi:hypothetical protein